ncbi:hypothetical protein [Brevibacterium sp. CT2-23B]|uniref:hypothetical protein n=1 Tax=Brevibacterium sp. CT2-23B TaxID=2729630 RepID=UPI00155670CA|nr:hypothetical protein [Brevibacterium sp. CT2-23B]
MTTTCKVCHRERHIKAAGMCRTCREKHLNKRMRAVGEAKARLIELIDHYGTLGTTAKAIGLARNTVVRIQGAELDSRIQRAAYAAIMKHRIADPNAPVAKRPDPITWPEVAEFAKTTEGLAFIERYKRPAAYRTRKAA